MWAEEGSVLNKEAAEKRERGIKEEGGKWGGGWKEEGEGTQVKPNSGFYTNSTYTSMGLLRQSFHP